MKGGWRRFANVLGSGKGVGVKNPCFNDSKPRNVFQFGVIVTATLS